MNDSLGEGNMREWWVTQCQEHKGTAGLPLEYTQPIDYYYE